MTDAQVQHPFHRTTLERWTWPLWMAGLTDRDGAVQLAQAVIREAARQRRRVLRPLRSYTYYTGTGQSWRMFKDVRPIGARLQVHIQRSPGDPWEPLYLEHSPQQWRGALLNQSRIRSMRMPFSRCNGNRRPMYEELVALLAEAAAEDYPGALQLRVRYLKLKIGTPAQIRAHGGLETGAYFWKTILPITPP